MAKNLLLMLLVTFLWNVLAGMTHATRAEMTNISSRWYTNAKIGNMLKIIPCIVPSIVRITDQSKNQKTLDLYYFSRYYDFQD